MVAAVARHGYGGASVAQVIEHAGVSRATFYKYFADKEECFLFAYREVAARVWESLALTPNDRPREVLAGILSSVDKEPAAARMVLIEALAGSHAVREEHERLLRRIEDSIDGYLEISADREAALAIPARAILGGVGNLMAIRVFQGETGRLVDLQDDLLTWLDAYSVPLERRPDRAYWAELGALLGIVPVESIEDASTKPGLPRGRGALPSGAVEHAHRDRVVAAVARLAREKGYAAMTVADIVEAAGVAREAFYRQFRSKKDAFLAAQSKSFEESIAATAGAFFAEGSWPERVWSGSIAALRYIATHPDMASAQLVENYAAGAAAIRRTFDTRMAYTLFLEDGYRERPEAESLPRLCSEAIAGAILEFIRHTATREETSRMLEAAPKAVFVSLAPFLGPLEALEFVEKKCQALGEAR